ncbi:MAG: acyl-CoA thioesterase [Bacteroidales bacterium]|nr:acyl-CoA thioesterase [Bacteroidales bacterium]
MKVDKYIHKVQYYETDKMGVTHHSNYVRWMEEARVNFLDKIGFGYRKLEEDGIISPVLAVECEFKNPTVFADEVEIETRVAEFRGVRLVMEYVMRKLPGGEPVLTGRTKHCFVTPAGRPIILEHSFPEFANKLKELLENS